MKMLGFEQVDLRGYECFDAVVATIANFYNREYHLMSLGQWSFGYRYRENTPIGQCIITDLNRNQNCLDYYHGLVFKKVNNCDIFKLIDMKKPLIMQLDLFDCAWDLDYQKYHFLHSIIMYAYSKEKKEIYCMDPFLKKNNIILSFDEVVSICKGFIVMEVVNRNQYNFYNEILMDIEFLNLNRCYKQMKEFCQDLKKIDWEFEMNGYKKDIYANPLINNIRILATRREGYTRMLERENQINGKFSKEIVMDSYDIVNKWKQIRIRLMKDCLSKKYRNNELLSEKVKEITNVEVEFWKKISDFIERDLY